MREEEEKIDIEAFLKDKKILEKFTEYNKQKIKQYLNEIKDERLKSFEMSKEKIADLIAQKSFMISQKKEADQKRKQLKPDMEGTAKKIEKSVGEKSFMISKKKESDEQRRQIKPDMEGTAKKIEKSVGEKSFMISKKKESDEQRRQIKPDMEGTAKKIEKSVGEKSFMISKKKSEDEQRKAIKVNVKEKSQILEDHLLKKRKEKLIKGEGTEKDDRSDTQKWLEQLKKHRKL